MKSKDGLCYMLRANDDDANDGDDNDSDDDGGLFQSKVIVYDLKIVLYPTVQ
jgi:hypothetical protein